MPEAPEVEVVVRGLRPFVIGRTIRAFRVVHPIAIKPQSPDALAKALQGNRIVKVTRRGKYLLLNLTRGSLVFHFKFDGQLLWFDRVPARGIHVDVLFHLDRGILGYVDPRHLGRANWYANPESVPALRSLGVDVFSRAFTAPALAGILGASRLPVKLLLMDQEKIAGLGNIYANEALWHARLNPRKLANRVTPEESRRLHKAIVSTVRRALECCSHPAPDFRNPEWWFADLSHMLRVYGREGERCRRCGGRIKRIQQSGRSSYFCPRCQR
jgi:formamidopyrimidine-DNA glycosylase